ncbi:MAG: hypothetical protein J2P50_06855 [Hyphomicrobiaceae bacterium]|nr:hypothetical protein [Hyphomicrobiaceae bacterium]
MPTPSHLRQLTDAQLVAITASMNTTSHRVPPVAGERLVLGRDFDADAANPLAHVCQYAGAIGLAASIDREVER